MASLTEEVSPPKSFYSQNALLGKGYRRKKIGKGRGGGLTTENTQEERALWDEGRSKYYLSRFSQMTHNLFPADCRGRTFVQQERKGYKG